MTNNSMPNITTAPTPTTEHARVITPTHPGFGGTPRQEALESMAALAEVYSRLLDELDLTDVTVVGNSIAAEIALVGSDRIVPPEHGRAYAAAIPNAEFHLINDAGHLPQLETPEQLLRAVWSFADKHATNRQ